MPGWPFQTKFDLKHYCGMSTTQSESLKQYVILHFECSFRLQWTVYFSLQAFQQTQDFCFDNRPELVPLMNIIMSGTWLGLFCFWGLQMRAENSCWKSRAAGRVFGLGSSVKYVFQDKCLTEVLEGRLVLSCFPILQNTALTQKGKTNYGNGKDVGNNRRCLIWLVLVHSSSEQQFSPAVNAPVFLSALSKSGSDQRNAIECQILLELNRARWYFSLENLD